MNKQDQIKAIAKLDGLKNPRQKKELVYCDDATEPGDIEMTVWVHGKNFKFEPSYLHSRDAIVSVIEKQHYDIKKGIFTQLACNLAAHPDPDLAAMLATPPQLCEALLRATGKWVD